MPSNDYLGKSNEELLASKIFDVKGLTAVVTGGGSGIGLMITQALAANGATVFITGRTQEKLDSVVQQYSKKGQECAGEIIGFSCDVTSKSDLKDIVSKVEKQAPNGINILVNNAGVSEEDSSGFDDIDPSDSNALFSHLFSRDESAWAKNFATNVTSPFFVTAAFGPLLCKGTQNTHGYSSTVINISSIAGIMKASSSAMFAYSASKAAAIQLTRNLASQFIPLKIRVNTIAPGLFPSEMTAGESNEQQKSKLVGKGKGLPAGRPGDDADMAAAVLYLASRGGVFLNGHVIHPDGGAVLSRP